MSLSPMNTRLLWKETRQLIPLACSIVVLACVPLVCFGLVNHRYSDLLGFAQTMAVVPPILFAIGAGSTLVSTEKESRSLNWLVSLPLPTKYLVRHQFVVGLLGLTVLWLGFLVIYSLIGFCHPDHPKLGMPYAIVLNSVYLMICGFTTAWLSRTPLLGLLSILVLAVSPYLVAYAVHYAFVESFTRGIDYHPDPSPWLTGLALLVFIVGIGWLGVTSAERQLTGRMNSAPSVRKQALSSSVQRMTRFIDDFLRGDSRLKTRPPTATGSLLWQFRNQNRSFIYANIAAFLLCLPIILDYFETRYRYRLFQPFLGATCMVVGFSTLSWVALLTFHGDHVQNRIRFLAIHGVGSTRVWFTRHVLPIAFLVFYVLVWWATANEHLMELSPQYPSYWIVGCGIVYAVSQWISQLIRPVILAALVSPVIAFVAAYLGAVACEELGTSLVVVLVALVLVPLLATWWMMPRWMDGRRGWTYWASHFGFTSVALLLPIHALVTWYVFAPSGFSAAERK
jgi:hypothetical protein